MNILDAIVTVCDECLTAACRHGEFMCEAASSAGTVDMPLRELRELALENPEYWFKSADGKINRAALAEYLEAAGMRQDALTRAARGQPCQIRLTGCTGGGEDTVACHYRLAGFNGVGMKPPSWMTAWGCAHCHSVADSREFLHGHSRDKVRLALAEAVFRTQAKLFEMGLLQARGVK